MSNPDDKLFNLLAPPPAPEWIKSVVRQNGDADEFFAAVDQEMSMDHEQAVAVFKTAFAKGSGPIKIKLPSDYKR